MKEDKSQRFRKLKSESPYRAGKEWTREMYEEAQAVLRTQEPGFAVVSTNLGLWLSSSNPSSATQGQA